MRRRKSKTSAPLSYRETLAKQGYHAVGCGGAVKPCLWLRKSLRNEGACYKEQFYGIHAHRCIQMTPTLHCNQQCLHCWRATDLDNTESFDFDEPQKLVDGSIAAQRKLIELAEPDYVVIKSYMHLGFSRKRLPRAAMMPYEDVEAFAQNVGELVGYKIAAGSPISRVVVLTQGGSIKKINNA